MDIRSCCCLNLRFEAGVSHQGNGTILDRGPTPLPSHRIEAGGDFETVTTQLLHHLHVTLGLDVAIEMVAALEAHLTQLALKRHLARVNPQVVL